MCVARKTENSLGTNEKKRRYETAKRVSINKKTIVLLRVSDRKEALETQ